MKFDVYGKFHVEVRREGGQWIVYKLGSGTRSRLNVVVPPIEEAEVPVYLDDLFHEASPPGGAIRRLD